MFPHGVVQDAGPGAGRDFLSADAGMRTEKAVFHKEDGLFCFSERFAIEKDGTRGGAAQRRPAQSERKNRAFSAKRQAVWFEMRSISN